MIIARCRSLLWNVEYKYCSINGNIIQAWSLHLLEDDFTGRFQRPFTWKIPAKKEAAIKVVRICLGPCNDLRRRAGRYVLIPPDEIAMNITLVGLVSQFDV